jgi:rhodanese-related sulfurtransferase
LDKDAQYAIYCRSGKRSVDAATAMDEIGFSTSNLTGGIIAWQESNNEIII